MGMIKNLFSSKQNESCCNIKIEEVKPQNESNCCTHDKETTEQVNSQRK